MIRKKFSKELYEQNDKDAKIAVRLKLDDMGVYTFSKEDYSADIKAIHRINHEVEVKLGWESDWPISWKTIHIPERKSKLIDGGDWVFFWVLRSDYKEAWVINSKLMNKSMLKEIPNKEISSGELFYDIPIELATKVKL